MAIPRSYLYVPGDQPQKLAKAATRGADALIIDLEDAVSPDRKTFAREVTRAYLEGVPNASYPQLWIRINPGGAALDDIAVAWNAQLSGVMLAKTESVADLERVDAALKDAEQAAGVPAGSTAVVPLVESASAVLSAQRIAGGPRVLRLQVGEADLGSEIGIAAHGGGEHILQQVRATAVLVSAAAALQPPIAPVSTNFRDLAEFRASTRQLAEMGFLGRACIHPDQVAVANEVFTPTAEEIADARALVDRFDAQVAAGSGVMLDQQGRFVDEAVVRGARRLLALADSPAEKS